MREEVTIEIDNSSFERVEQFIYLGTTYIQEEIKSKLKTENACYHSVQSLLSSNFLPKNMNNKIY